MRNIIAVATAGLLLSACQSTDPQDYAADRDCLQKKAGSKIVSKLVGMGAGMVVPGGGIVGRGVALATDPRCQAFRLTPEARERISREPPSQWTQRVDPVPSVTMGPPGAR
jgi:hypothetical protein